MTPLDVAKYVRAFQKAATTRKVKSRMIRRESRFDDNLAELIRAILPKGYVRLNRRRGGYELHWMGSQEQAGRLIPMLPPGQTPFRSLLDRAQYRQYDTSHWIGQPTEELLDNAVALQPILARFKRDEARRAAGETVDVTAPEPLSTVLAPEVAGPTHAVTIEEDPINGEDEFLEENEEEAIVGTPVHVAEEIRPAVNRQNLEAQFAEAARARQDALAGREQPPVFATEGERAFAAMLARARGRQ